jgi:uncharacterized membrane protein YkgB
LEIDMHSLTQLVARISYPFLRIAMGIVLVWIGGLKFADPSAVVGLLGASEIVVGLLLFASFQVKYVGILTMALFAGTLAIFVFTPMVAYGDRGFPLLTLPGEFLLKDVALMAGCASLSTMASTREMARTLSTDQARLRAS